MYGTKHCKANTLVITMQIKNWDVSSNKIAAALIQQPLF